MCEATTALLVGGTLLSAYEKYQTGQAEAKQLEQQAKIREMQAADARLRGQSEAGMKRLETGTLVQEQKLDFAAAGVDVSVGTPTEVYSNTRQMGELEAAIIENNAAREAWGFQVGAQTSRAGAASARYAGTLGAASTLVGGGASAAMAHDRLKVEKTAKTEDKKAV